MKEELRKKKVLALPEDASAIRSLCYRHSSEDWNPADHYP